MATVRERIMHLQTFLHLEADGVIGPDTLTAIEQRILPPQSSKGTVLHVSRKGIKQLVQFEISSEGYYRKFLQSPTWPGGASGITIGIGYDLGYCSTAECSKAWSGKISDADLARLTQVTRLKGDTAQEALPSVADIKVPLSAANEVFYLSTLPQYAEDTAKTYPGVELLFADAQTALLSLVYNRGTRLSGSHRVEMKAIQPLVTAQDYPGIAAQIRKMKRLWIGKGLDGLLARRDAEAQLCLEAARVYPPDELIHL